MKALSVAFWLVLCLPTTLLAQTIRIQSGEHDGFTRLVLQIGTDREWDLAQDAEQQWTLSLTPSIDGFDTSGVFELIQRTRLASLASNENLLLNLACDCDVSSFRHDQRYLVIDIADPDPNTVPTTPPLDADAENTSGTADALPNLTDLLLAPTNLPSVSPILPARDLRASPSDLTLPGEPLARAEDEPNQRLAEAAEIMAEQLARAAASGLLDAALLAPTAPDLPIAPEPTEEVAPTDGEIEIEVAAPSFPNAQQPVLEESSFPEGALPIRTETGLDPQLDIDLPSAARPAEGACQGAPLNARDWSQGSTVDHGLGALRLALYDERDVLIDDAAVALALHYLAFGFGAEAVYWLDQTASPPRDLLHIADLVDGATSASFPNVDTPTDCSEGELLWRYVAGAVTSDLTEDDTSTLQRGHADLPRALRDQIGPDLARRLASDGHHSTARNVRDTLQRGGRVDAVTLRLLDLDLRIPPSESPAETQDFLAEALRDDGGDPVSIMTHSLNFDRTNGTSPDPARLVAADALMRETGMGPETDDLWREILLGHARIGQIEEALVRLGDPMRSAEARAEALTDLIADRVEVNDTAALVVLAYTYGRSWRPEGSTAGRIQVRAIAALRAEGLFEAAQILRDVRRPLILPADPDQETEVNDPAIEAWAQADWPRLAQEGIGTHADIAARMARLNDADVPVPSATAPDLNALNETVEDSRVLRQSIAALLERPTPP